MVERTVAVVGAGFSGTLTAIHLARRGARVVLIERETRQAARGVAYATPHPQQLLNVRAGGMSAFADDPSHFARWLEQRGGAAADFVSRALYGAYLRELLVEAQAEADGRLELRRGEVRDVDAAGVVLAGGTRVDADTVVLAIGNLSPHDPARMEQAGLAPDVYVADPWAGDPVAGLATGDRVLLLGTGLTAVDVALTLDAAGFAGETLALSRRGLDPRGHVVGQPSATGLTEAAQMPLSALLREARGRAVAGDWREAVDAMRPVTQALWSGADAATRARFLRHLRPFWDVHRHRLAPQVAARIQEMIAEGRLLVAGGKVTAVAPDPGGARVTWRPRHHTGTESAVFRRVVNCTGPQSDLTRTDDALVARLRERGVLRPDALRLGIDVDADSRVIGGDGVANTQLYCVGPMTRGALWEIVAVPDLRGQVAAVAERIAT